MFKKIFVLLFLFTLLFGGCSIFQKESFAGKWQITFAGDYEKSVNFEINDDLTFSFNDVVSLQNGDFPITIKGKVSEEGKLDALIFTQGDEVGELNGQLTFTEGTGKWSGANLGGTWSAVKEQ